MANFITATLHDNDFHRDLMAGVAYIAQHAEHELTEDEYSQMALLLNKRVRVTVEILD